MPESPARIATTKIRVLIDACTRVVGKSCLLGRIDVFGCAFRIVACLSSDARRKAQSQRKTPMLIEANFENDMVVGLLLAKRRLGRLRAPVADNRSSLIPALFIS